MEPVKQVKAWACAGCGNVWRVVKHEPTKNGRAFAELCCVCRRCGKGPTPYTCTPGALCSACKREDDDAHILENYANAYRQKEALFDRRAREAASKKVPPTTKATAR